MPKKPMIRSCCACRKRGEKHEFIRIVRTPEGFITLDPKKKISGRGIYVCRSMKCIEKACQDRAIERGFKRNGVSADIYERLKIECQQTAQSV